MSERCKVQGLTNRQLEVLDLLRKGLTNAEICRALNISENTVKIHLANIYKTLEVSNRTEAVAAVAETAENWVNSDEVRIRVIHDSDIKDHPLVYELFHGIVENFQEYRLFLINTGLSDEIVQDSTYQIKISASQDGNQAFISLLQGNNKAIIWSQNLKLDDASAIDLYADQYSIVLFRNMIISAAKVLEQNSNASPAWWYATSYSIIKSENRSRDCFEKCMSMLQSLTVEGDIRNYVLCSQASIYYLGISENWVNGEEYVKKIGELACDTMRNNPSSAYSMFTMALYNILLGKKNEAIVYFEGILLSNPLNVMCRRLLVQLYMLMGREEDALKQLDEIARLVPNGMDQPFQFVAKAMIYFLQGNYDFCEKVSRQVLMFHPEIPFARLFVIACNNKKGDLDEVKKQVKIFYEYHPNFTRNDLERFIGGVSPNLKQILLEAIQNIFD